MALSRIIFHVWMLDLGREVLQNISHAVKNWLITWVFICSFYSAHGGHEWSIKDTKTE